MIDVTIVIQPFKRHGNMYYEGWLEGDDIRVGHASKPTLERLLITRAARLHLDFDFRVLDAKDFNPDTTPPP